MVNSLFQWLMIAFFSAVQTTNISVQNHPAIYKMDEAKNHPLYISIIDVTHNAKDNVLELSVRIFTDDFENTLKKYSTAKVDLSHPADKAATDKLINNYLLSRLQIKADNKPVKLNYLGFELQQESIWTYFEVPNISSVKKIEVNTTILYDYQEKQINIIHAKVNGDEKSFRLDNPKSYAAFEW
ncbi:MAG TPA: DUF6702 family protein [Chitinophagaceae bacterium]|nr:DUF6702 family protein [Chitinophagaceae bacterium]